jgi:hypothetical protein
MFFFLLLNLSPPLELLLAHQPLLVHIRAPAKQDVTYICQRLKRLALALPHPFHPLFRLVGIFGEQQRIHNPTNRGPKRALYCA